MGRLSDVEPVKAQNIPSVVDCPGAHRQASRDRAVDLGLLGHPTLLGCGRLNDTSIAASNSNAKVPVFVEGRPGTTNINLWHASSAVRKREAAIAPATASAGREVG